MTTLWHKLVTLAAMVLTAVSLLVSGGAVMAMEMDGCDMHPANWASAHEISAHGTHDMDMAGDPAQMADMGAADQGMADCGMHACVFDLPTAAPLHPSLRPLLQVLAPTETQALTSRAGDGMGHPPKI
ncbi:hypothetical protein LA6_000651 [Marinibacterium anthonyi]|nr:hypothetical protein LA6_000651 [Marinibacterium anthonyi]